MNRLKFGGMKRHLSNCKYALKNDVSYTIDRKSTRLNSSHRL